MFKLVGRKLVNHKPSPLIFNLKHLILSLRDIIKIHFRLKRHSGISIRGSSVYFTWSSRRLSQFVFFLFARIFQVFLSSSHFSVTLSLFSAKAPSKFQNDIFMVFISKNCEQKTFLTFTVNPPPKYNLKAILLYIFYTFSLCIWTEFLTAKVGSLIWKKCLVSKFGSNSQTCKTKPYHFLKILSPKSFQKLHNAKSNKNTWKVPFCTFYT